MISPILIDANIPIYAMGREHAMKEPSLRILDLATEFPRSFLTDAEVLQELIHRSLALRQWPQTRPYFFEFAILMSGRVESMTAEDVERAAVLADGYSFLSARDLIHLAVMQRVGCTRIATADSAFDHIDGIERLDPMRFDEWAPSITDPI